MTAFPIERNYIEKAFLDACRAELQALKPGNVHVHSAGHGMEIAHFERAAAAAAPHIADPALRVGARVLAAVEASFAATGLNTNLGIVLLSAPLAAAADMDVGSGDLKARLETVLDGLDRDDAKDAFRAIMVANPGGLGRADEADVAGPATVTLKDAMALAADRDRIARAYITAFDDIFSLALPRLEDARRSAVNGSLAITALHMGLLASFPDSHIARKYGLDVAVQVQEEARELKEFWWPPPRPDSLDVLLKFDADLKGRGLNPGTTADFVVATLFAETLIRQSATTERS